MVISCLVHSTYIYPVFSFFHVTFLVTRNNWILEICHGLVVMSRVSFVKSAAGIKSLLRVSFVKSITGIQFLKGIIFEIGQVLKKKVTCYFFFEISSFMFAWNTTGGEQFLGGIFFFKGKLAQKNKYLTGYLRLSRIKIRKIVTSIVTSYIGVKIIQGLVGVSRAGFTDFVKG